MRYPGSKAKIVKKLIRAIPSNVMDPLFHSEKLEYREPFFGAGALGLEVLNRGLPDRSAVWINDIDLGMCSYWNSIYSDHEGLIEMVEAFTPSKDLFYRFKEEDGSREITPVRLGFQKLALHQMSFSGLGFKAGGPIGGRRQSSEYNVDCRWNPSKLKLDIKKQHELLQRFASVQITARDFSELIVDAPSTAFIYADPPYYVKGPALYRFSMNDADHLRLAGALRECRAQWVLSYDDHPFIREAYSWASITSVDVRYTMAIEKDKRRKNSEIIITPNRAKSAQAA